MVLIFKKLVTSLDVVELAYQELFWRERIAESIDRLSTKKKVKRCWYKSVGFICFAIGLITGIIMYIKFDVVQNVVDSILNLLPF